MGRCQHYFSYLFLFGCCDDVSCATAQEGSFGLVLIWCAPDLPFLFTNYPFSPDALLERVG